MPKIAYETQDGLAVPGATTVISGQCGWNKRALMYWSWREGCEGRDYRETQEKAADVGTHVHQCIEATLHKRDWPPMPEGFTKEQWTLSLNSTNAFLAWQKRYGLVVIGSEISLVNEEYLYGGTIDHVEIAGERCLVDIKTSKEVYADHKLQLAAYGHLPGMENLERYHLLRVGKADGSFHHHSWEPFINEWVVFRNLVQNYWLQKKIKDR